MSNLFIYCLACITYCCFFFLTFIIRKLEMRLAEGNYAPSIKILVGCVFIHHHHHHYCHFYLSFINFEWGGSCWGELCSQGIWFSCYICQWMSCVPRYRLDFIYYLKEYWFSDSYSPKDVVTLAPVYATFARICNLWLPQPKFCSFLPRFSCFYVFQRMETKSCRD